MLLQVLAAGLSGLYSMLPRSLTIESEGWHRLTAEDINDLPQLQLFLNSLEFCNAVVQVSLLVGILYSVINISWIISSVQCKRISN